MFTNLLRSGRRALHYELVMHSLAALEPRLFVDQAGHLSQGPRQWLKHREDSLHLRDVMVAVEWSKEVERSGQPITQGMRRSIHSKSYFKAQVEGYVHQQIYHPPQ